MHRIYTKANDMKRYIIYLLILFTIIYSSAGAQDIPEVRLSTAAGENFDALQLNKITDKPVVLAFWATWCIPCLNELTAINDNLDDWKEKSSFEFYAVSVDDSRTVKKVQPLAKGKNWNFPVLLDKNQELKRELNLPNVPYTIVLKNGKIIYRHSGYTEGHENELYKVIKDNQ